MNKLSEKAMQLARKMLYEGCDKQQHFVGVEQAASEIDAHTAEAIAPYKKALDEAERALTGSISYVNCFSSKNFSGHKEAKAKADEMIKALTTIRAIKGE